MGLVLGALVLGTWCLVLGALYLGTSEAGFLGLIAHPQLRTKN